MEEKKRNDEKTWAIFCHLSSLACFLGIPFGNILGPLVIWLVKKDEYPLVDENGKESLNFQISVLIYALVSGLLILVLIGVVLIAALVIFDLVMVIAASVNTSNGKPFKYPLTIRFIK